VGRREVPQDGAEEVVARIVRYHDGREPERLAIKYRAMRRDAFTFFRGTAHLFWEDWAADAEATAALDEAPLAWACGDLHLENFGTYRGDNRLAYFDLNDFDEAALAPALRDPARLITSVHLASETLGISRSDTTDLCNGYVDAYAATLAGGKARWVERATATGMVKELLRGLKARTRANLLDLRTVFDGKRRRLRVDGRRALTLPRTHRTDVLGCLHDFAREHELPKFYKVLDIARRVAGTGSLGVGRFVVLVEGHGSPDGNVLLDLKEAIPSTLAMHISTPQPAWRSEAERVLRVQRRMQAIEPAMLHAVTLDGRQFVLRELQPTQDRLALEHWHGKLRRLRRVATTMGELTAWAQLRSRSLQGAAGADELIAFANAKHWREHLLKYARRYADRVQRDWKAYVAGAPVT
jgi:uncharacterized protein (DUF2252 family)